MTKKKHFSMPSAYEIVFIALVIVAILTFFIPVSVRDPQTGQVVYNATFDENGNIVEDAGPQPAGIWDILMAPVKGFIDSSNVGIAIFMAGAFLTVLNSTGALEAGIGHMLERIHGPALIALMNLAFALMGTVFGFWEEILAFAIVVVPMFVMAGYDVMMGFGVLFLGSTVGNMTAVVNPFATGAAVASISDPNLTMGSGIVLRMVTFALLYVLSTLLLLRYGARVKKDPSTSIVHGVPGIKTSVDGSVGKNMPELTKKRLASVWVFIVIILLMIIGYIPWEQLGGSAAANFVNAPFDALEKVPFVGDLLGAAHITRFGDWGFNEFSVLFFAGSLILLLINRMKMGDFLKSFLDGAKEMMGVVFVLAIARGIAVVMGTSQQGMSVTLVYWISNALSSVPQWVFPIFTVGAFILIGLALQSTSGVAALSMPILGAVAAAVFSGTSMGAQGGEVLLISCFAAGLNFMTLIYPGAVTMGTSEMFHVPYNDYLKLVLKPGIVLVIAATLLISIAPYIGLVM